MTAETPQYNPESFEEKAEKVRQDLKKYDPSYEKGKLDTPTIKAAASLHAIDRMYTSAQKDVLLKSIGIDEIINNTYGNFDNAILALSADQENETYQQFAKDVTNAIQRWQSSAAKLTSDGVLGRKSLEYAHTTYDLDLAADEEKTQIANKEKKQQLEDIVSSGYVDASKASSYGINELEAGNYLDAKRNAEQNKIFESKIAQNPPLKNIFQTLELFEGSGSQYIKNAISTLRQRVIGSETAGDVITDWNNRIQKACIQQVAAYMIAPNEKFSQLSSGPRSGELNEIAGKIDGYLKAPTFPVNYDTFIATIQLKRSSGLASK